MPRSEVIAYKGIRYRRYPDSEKWAERSYYVPGIADRQRLGLGRLHEEIWKDLHGPIPDGCHVHHADRDPLNNEPDNLVCLSSDEHKRYHASLWDRSTPEWLEHLERIRPKAAEWHGSAEGIEWHRQHGIAAAEARELLTFTCEQCGAEYQTKARGDATRFCSNKCKSAWRRASGVDDEQRTCENCGETFTVNKYSRVRFCGRSCGRSHAWAQRAAGLRPDCGRRARVLRERDPRAQLPRRGPLRR